MVYRTRTLSSETELPVELKYWNLFGFIFPHLSFRGRGTTVTRNGSSRKSQALNQTIDYGFETTTINLSKFNYYSTSSTSSLINQSNYKSQMKDNCEIKMVLKTLSMSSMEGINFISKKHSNFSRRDQTRYGTSYGEKTIIIMFWFL